MTSTAAVENTDPLLTTTEAARYLNRPPGTLRQWRHHGHGPRGFRAGGVVMYRRSALDTWVTAMEAAEADNNRASE